MSPATRSTQRFCPECGAKVTKTQRFCRECGTDLQASADETVELSKPASRGRAAASTPKPAASPALETTRRLPPPPPPPPAPADRSARGLGVSTDSAPPWPAWLAAGACGVLVIATGLQWFGGGFGIDGLDVPLAVLFSDTATGGIPIGVLFLLVAAVGLGVALFNPAPRPLSLTFLITGGISTLFILWYMVRALTSVEGAPLFDVLSIGFWLALLASLGVLAGGIALRMAARRTSA